MTKKQFKALKLPVFVRVKWADCPDSVNLLYDQELNTVMLNKKGNPFRQRIDGIDQIVAVLGPVKFPKLPQ